MRTRTLLAALILAAAGGLTRADDKPVERTDLDRKIANAVYESALLGTDLFNNQKNYDGCYRLYQGTLIAVTPLLDHRSVLQGKVKMRLERAAENLKSTKWKAADAAFELRTALDEIQNEIAPSKEGAGKTAWDRLGGETGARKIADDIILVVAEDKDVNLFRGGKPDPKALAAVKQGLVDFMSANSGGPQKSADLGEAFKGVKLTDAGFDALKGHLVKTLKKRNVPDADANELAKAFEAARKDVVEKK